MSIKLYTANIKPIISQETQGVVHRQQSAISNPALIKTDQSEAFIPMPFLTNFNNLIGSSSDLVVVLNSVFEWPLFLNLI